MTHADLVARAARWLRNTMRCSVVLTERTLRSGGEVPDAIGWTRQACHVVECKASRSDFCADRAKAHRRVPAIAMGQLRYFLTPPGLLKTDDIPDGFGLLEVEAFSTCVRTIVKAAAFPDSNRHRELCLLLSELGRYQRHGITYPPLPRPGAQLAPFFPDLDTEARSSS